MTEIQVMRGVLGTNCAPSRWVRLKQTAQSVEIFIMAADNSTAAFLTPDEANCLADQLYELARRISAPVPIKRDDRGRFVA